MKLKSTVVLAALTLSGAAASLQAQTSIFGLGAGNALLNFSSVPVAGSIVVTTIAPIGVPGGQTVVGIDFRPLDGLLYAVARDALNQGFLYTVNTTTGAVTPITINQPPAFTLTGNVGVDFNPAAATGANALRVVTSNAANFRLTGFTTAGTPTTVTNNADTALNPGTPNVVGTAYSNNVAGIPGGNGVGGTVQYAIDATTNALYTVPTPNNGTLAIVGTGLGVDPSNSADGDLDIVTGTDRALATLSTNGTNYGLYEVTLGTGTASLLGTFSGTQPIDIAAPIPEPSSAALLLGGLGLIAARRRKRA